MGAVVNTELGLSLLEVCANGLFTELKQLRGFTDWVPDRQQPENGELTGRQRRSLTNAANLRSDKLLQTDGRECRSHEKDRASLLREPLRQHIAGPIGHHPTPTDGTVQTIAHAVLQRQLEWPAVYAQRIYHAHQFRHREWCKRH